MILKGVIMAQCCGIALWYLSMELHKGDHQLVLPAEGISQLWLLAMVNRLE